MGLYSITFTGADDKVDPNELVRISKQYPEIAIEWGILFSISAAGKQRYPTSEWVSSLTGLSGNFAAHLCGQYVDDIGKIRGSEDYERRTLFLENFENNEIFKRVQINSGMQPPKDFILMHYLRCLNHFGEERMFIVQSNGKAAGHTVMLASHGFGGKVSTLYDCSGGKGIETEFQEPVFNSRWGFAGGISPENVVDKLVNISSVYSGEYWIDMESGVRTNNNFDLNKVVSVIEQAIQFNRDHE